MESLNLIDFETTGWIKPTFGYDEIIKFGEKINYLIKVKSLKFSPKTVNLLKIKVFSSLARILLYSLVTQARKTL